MIKSDQVLEAPCTRQNPIWYNWQCLSFHHIQDVFWAMQLQSWNSSRPSRTAVFVSENDAKSLCTSWLIFNTFSIFSFTEGVNLGTLPSKFTHLLCKIITSLLSWFVIVMLYDMCNNYIHFILVWSHISKQWK